MSVSNWQSCQPIELCCEIWLWGRNFILLPEFLSSGKSYLMNMVLISFERNLDRWRGQWWLHHQKPPHHITSANFITAECTIFTRALIRKNMEHFLSAITLNAIHIPLKFWTRTNGITSGFFSNDYSPHHHFAEIWGHYLCPSIILFLYYSALNMYVPIRTQISNRSTWH